MRIKEHYIVYSYECMGRLEIREFYFRKPYSIGMRSRGEIEQLIKICKNELLECYPGHIDVTPIPIVCLLLQED